MTDEKRKLSFDGIELEGSSVDSARHSQGVVCRSGKHGEHWKQEHLQQESVGAAMYYARVLMCGKVFCM